MQGRSREILQPERHGGIPCEGDPQEMQGCNMEACPSKICIHQVYWEKCIIDMILYVIFTFSLLCFQFAKIIQDMQDFVLRGQSFVLTVSSFRAAVKSHADYAKNVSNYKCHFTF